MSPLPPLFQTARQEMIIMQLTEEGSLSPVKNEQINQAARKASDKVQQVQ